MCSLANLVDVKIIYLITNYLNNDFNYLYNVYRISRFYMYVCINKLVLYFAYPERLREKAL